LIKYHKTIILRLNYSMKLQI